MLVSRSAAQSVSFLALKMRHHKTNNYTKTRPTRASSVVWEEKAARLLTLTNHGVIYGNHQRKWFN
jgi:hypothetical protein